MATVPQPHAALKPKDPIDGWIADIVRGQTFVDIGGIGVDSCNERVTFASAAGARRTAIADIRPFTYFEWDLFAKKAAAAGVTQYDRYENVDITNPSLPERLPVFDVVHCTASSITCRIPWTRCKHLRKVVGKHLIINTVTIPERVSNEKGTLEFKGNVALFLPGLSAREREILTAHYAAKFPWKFDDVAPPLERQTGAIMPYFEKGQFSCWPYWWLMSDDCFRSLTALMGFRIKAKWKWEEHCLALLCEKL